MSESSLSFVVLRRRLLLAGLVTFLALAALGAGIAVGSWRNVCYDCPSIAQIYAWEPTRSTKILTHDGRLIAELGQQRRTPVALEDLPRYVPEAFIAVEDKRFYRHNGFDPLGYARAARNLILKRRIAGGGSTITIQLARHMFMEEVGFDQSFGRKLKELRVALDLEKIYSKDEILQAYINVVNYGQGHYGIESASQWFFGKPATAINPAEAALLAAVINLPEHYSPFKHPDRARTRRNLVLRLMADQGYLTPSEAERWSREPLPETPHINEEGNIAPYFVEWVRGILDDRFGSDLYRSGYRVYTSLDLEMQRRAQEAMENGWARVEQVPGYGHPTYAEVVEEHGNKGMSATPYLQGMFIAMEAKTGEVRALIGGRNFGHSKFNRATQAMRQPGSVFKPFVYTAAIASRIPASQIIIDAPIMIPQPDSTEWKPRNYGGNFSGPVTLREALRRSINIPTIKIAQEVGLETVVQYARRLGIQTPIPRVPAIAIGAADVLPIQVAEAYSAFATHGTRTRPRPILRVEDAEGRVLWQTSPERDQVLDPLTAAIVTDMLRGVVDGGTATTAVRGPQGSKLPYTIPAAGKTGTTNDYTDVWFAGFTPDLLAVVWLGFDNPTQILPNATGGGYAAPIWGDFMQSVYTGEEALRPPPEPWVMPEGLTTRRIDRKSGKLATEWCPENPDDIQVEYFLPGTEPTEACVLDDGGLFGAPLGGFGGDLLPPPPVAEDTLGADTLGIDPFAPAPLPRPDTLPDDRRGRPGWRD